MDTENNEHLQVRIAVASILALVGVAFMSRLPQLLPGQQAISWYQSGFFWAGIAIVVIALLILIVAPKRWRHLWYSVLGFPQWFFETCEWQIYGPKCGVDPPIVTSGLSPNGQMRVYSAKVSLSLKKTRNCYPAYYPGSIVIDKPATCFYLEQKGVGREPVSIELEVINGSIKNTSFPLAKIPYEVSFSRSVPNHAVEIDIRKATYRWGVIEIHLTGIKKVRKLSGRGRLSNGKK